MEDLGAPVDPLPRRPGSGTPGNRGAPVPSAEALKAAAAAAEEAAAAEGLELMPSSNASSGFYGVSFQPGNAAKPWKAMVKPHQGGPQIRLANFATKEEAALAVARHFGKDGQARLKSQIAEKARPPPSAAEIAAEVEAEGLVLISDTNASGYKGVFCDRFGKWVATLHMHGKKHHLGIYGTAQEAALAYARRLRQETAEEDRHHIDARARRQSEAVKLHLLDAAGVRRLAEEEGLELVAGEGESNFRGVVRSKRKTRWIGNRPYQAYIYPSAARCSRKNAPRRVSIGFPCNLPEQAALLLARHHKAEAEAVAEGRGGAFMRQLLEASARLEEEAEKVKDGGSEGEAEEEEQEVEGDVEAAARRGAGECEGRVRGRGVSSRSHLSAGSSSA
jgi:hypothetical protein